jgi:hypothetical protein
MKIVDRRWEIFKRVAITADKFIGGGPGVGSIVCMMIVVANKSEDSARSFTGAKIFAPVPGPPCLGAAPIRIDSRGSQRVQRISENHRPTDIGGRW